MFELVIQFLCKIWRMLFPKASALEAEENPMEPEKEPEPVERLEENSAKIVFCTTCKGRTFHLKETLPKNLRDNPNSKFLVLNYSSNDGLLEYVTSTHREDLDSGRLVVYTFLTDLTFNVAHAKNMAARLGIREGADVLVTLDADNFAGPNFERYIREKIKEPGTFLCPDFERIQAMPWGPNSERPLRGFAGRLAVRAQDFIKAGGYNEVYNTWRGEDIDFNARMGRMGYTPRFIDNCYLKTIPHNAEVRFKEYPWAQRYEAPGAWKIKGKNTDTVVNYGKFGLGIVYKNEDTTPIVLKPVPTRVFGIGMQKTATNSLHKAFQTLGLDSLHWGSGEAPLIWGEVNSSGRSKTLEKFYAISDMPIPLLYQKLDKAYPGSKFILTIRNEEAWIKSVERLWDYKYNPTRWEWDVWPISNRLHRALYGRTDFDRTTMLNRYRKHNAEVLEYFKDRPQDLLVMDMDTDKGWESLCGFLDVPIPGTSYPREWVTKLIGSTKCSI
jgi:hypothetical protein